MNFYGNFISFRDAYDFTSLIYELTSKRNLTYCFFSVNPADGETGKFISRTISPHSFFFVTYKCSRLVSDHPSFGSSFGQGQVGHVTRDYQKILSGIINCI